MPSRTHRLGVLVTEERGEGWGGGGLEGQVGCTIKGGTGGLTEEQRTLHEFNTTRKEGRRVRARVPVQEENVFVLPDKKPGTVSCDPNLSSGQP